MEVETEVQEAGDRKVAAGVGGVGSCRVAELRSQQA